MIVDDKSVCDLSNGILHDYFAVHRGDLVVETSDVNSTVNSCDSLVHSEDDGS